MYIQTNALMVDLDKYEEIFIWGAGFFGIDIYKRLCRTGRKKKVKNFVVTELNCSKNIENISVIAANELEELNDSCVILIAVLNSQYIDEIERVIYDKKYSNVIKLIDYCISIEQERRFLREISFSDMMKYVAEWYLFKKIGEESNYTLVKKHLLELSTNRNHIDKKKIVFIIGLAYIRTPKIAIALKKKGYNIKVLQIYNGYHYAGQSELAEGGIELDICEDIAEVLYKALRENPLVYYIDPPWMDSSLAMFMIYNKKNYGKFVFGEYDIQKIAMLPNIPEYYYTTEQYAIENADGVVWRYDAKDYLEQKYGYYCKGKSIQFYDYCNDYAIQLPIESDKRLKFCTLPTHLEELVNIPDIDRKYTHSADIYEILKLIGNRQDCMLDVYIWSYHEENLPICKEIEKQYRNIKFYFRVKHSELIKRMGKYDYGLALFKENCKPQYYNSCIANFITEPTSECAASNKYFDYIAAGLPVITHLSRRQTDYMDKYGVIVKMDIDHFDIEYLKIHKEKYRNQVKKALPYLLLDNQIHRLIDFMEKL